jgi:nucleotide-binding universal stress UspA family protein
MSEAAELSVQKVLFATDFSPATTNAFSHALAITNRYQATLIVAHIINLESFALLDDEPARGAIEQSRAEAVRKIKQLLEPLHLSPDRYGIAVGEGVISEALVDVIQNHHIDVAVLGTHGRRGFQKLRMGSVAEEVFRVSPCPVLIVGTNAKPADPEGLKHVLYPVHFVPDTHDAAAYAVSLAERYGAKLTVMNVRDDMAASANVSAPVTEPVERWMNDHIAADSGLRQRVRFEAGFGSAANAILDFAVKGGVDMIVMSIRVLDPAIAAHLPTADTAYELVTSAPCPVLTVRE